MAVRRSVVKWFDAKKGYGFIVHPDGGNDVFVHYTQIDNDRRFKTLRTGQVVEFDLADGPKGVHAREVTPLEDQQEADVETSGYPERLYEEHDAIHTTDNVLSRGL